jgi:hypothetical protein
MLLASSVAALLLLGGGSATAGLGYVNLGNLLLPRQAEEDVATVQPAAKDPPKAPETPVASQKPKPAPDNSQATTLVPVPNVNAYFDYFAKETLANSGFQTRVIYGYREGYAPSGVTWGTDPAPGTPMPPGSTITVYATPEDQPQIVTQPQVVNQPQIQPQPQPQPQIRS